jgi:hypothetical protein
MRRRSWTNQFDQTLVLTQQTCGKFVVTFIDRGCPLGSRVLDVIGYDQALRTVTQMMHNEVPKPGEEQLWTHVKEA